jgi:hypothetical protein
MTSQNLPIQLPRKVYLLNEMISGEKIICKN